MRWAVVAVLAAGCPGVGIFHCELDPDCGPEGRCEPTGYCSFPDPGCGWRYGEHAPAEFANHCVDSVDLDGPPLPDGGGRADAGPDGAAGLCATLCPGTCVDSICTLTCDGLNGCPGTVVCPPGLDCRVVCSGDGSCTGGIDCTVARSCQVECSGFTACAGAVLCGGDACSVQCINQGTCQGAIDCQAADCTIGCFGQGACGSDVDCGPGFCDIVCAAPGSCAFVDCTSACACNLDCSGISSCYNFDCPPGCDTGDSCTALAPGCDDC